MHIFGFQLGREWKLSVAEIASVFPTTQKIYSSAGIFLVDGVSKEEILKKASTLGGTIKIFQAELCPDLEDIYAKILHQGMQSEGKFKYSLNLFGEKQIPLEKILKKTKYQLKNRSVSARYFNKDNGKNLTSAQILGNSILKKGFDYNIVNLGGMFYFGKTLWVQDIDAYSKRDFEKQTDMQIGMLPPKLCQMMINLGTLRRGTTSTPPPGLPLSGGGIETEIPLLAKEGLGEVKNSIYDPFVGLGTVLIEALNMGYTDVFGSDLNEKMVETASNNLYAFTEKYELDANYAVIKLNAKFINEAPFFEGNISQIVTEGYLGEIMTKKNISYERIAKQKESLLGIYTKFFENLSKTNFSGTITICFPFWELDKKYIYFNEITEILEQYCTIKNIFENRDFDLATKMGSLLYKREKQLVGREIYVLELKK